MEKTSPNEPTLRVKKILWCFCLAVSTILGAQNQAGDQYEPQVIRVEFTPDGGFYAHSVSVQLLSPGARIYFTTDGSKPEEFPEMRYSGPIMLHKTTVIRAIAVIAGLRSEVYSRTYFINEPESRFPIVSVSVNPSLLFDPIKGLLVKGNNASETIWYMPGANFWSRRELPVNFEFYETDGKIVVHQQAGLRIFGGFSRLFPQKSLALVARSRYGGNRFRHRFFGKNYPRKYKYLVLRNSGSDFGKTHFRDILITSLVKNWNLDLQAFRLVHAYINGNYWGIYHLREKINRHFIATHHGVDKDSIDLIEHRLTLRHGSTAHYRRLLQFLERNSLHSSGNYAYVKSQMDVSNFMDHQIVQIYFDNRDAGGNIKFWRPTTKNGRWRWILFDTDWGFGLNDPKAYRFNSLAFHTEPNGPDWPNPPWSTFLLRKLLENKEFERQFLNRFADYMNTDLEPGFVLSKIEYFYDKLKPEISRHLRRWNLKEKQWEAEVDVLRTFARERPAFMYRFLMERFNTGTLQKLHLDISAGGKIIINENIEKRDSFNGFYFEKIPVRLHAIPDLGCRFVRWEGPDVQSESPELYLQLSRNHWNIRAVFEKHLHHATDKVIINEISCNNKKSKDWIEIYNRSKDRINLAGWLLTDNKHVFHFPDYTLPPKGYVIVCEDSVQFLREFPHVQSIISGLNFGLHKRRENIQLFAEDGSMVDSVGYLLEPTDSVFTLNLLLPHLNNSDPDNWELSPGYGSPGAANAYFVASRIKGQRYLFMQIGAGLGVLALGVMLLWLRKKGIF